MRKLFTHTTEISSREEYDKAMTYMNKLIADATEKGFLSSPNADNEYTREIGRIGRLCADFEDKKISFSHITVRGRSPLVRVLQEEMLRRDLKQKDAARLLGINDAAFSLFMTGKRHLSMASAKKLYEKMRIDPRLILKYA